MSVFDRCASCIEEINRLEEELSHLRGLYKEQGEELRDAINEQYRLKKSIEKFVVDYTFQIMT